MWSWIVGNGGALLLKGSVVMVDRCSLAVAEELVTAANHAHLPPGTPERVESLHRIVLELYGLVDQMLNTREAAGQSVKDDRGRSLALLRAAGDALEAERAVPGLLGSVEAP